MLWWMLKLLETCVKNCGKRFHLHIATKEFMQEMIKIISPKYNPSVELQNTVLNLIQVMVLCAYNIAALILESCVRWHSQKPVATKNGR